ncbi:MAG: hypothetical protein IPN86_10270 [Saprospiraceae bacterium]|nr:hypothetical protein [Saprospiraceae bacterium]
MIKWVLFITLLLSTKGLYSQEKSKGFVSKDSLYNENIKKSRLYGVYIPRDIDDAMSKLMELTTEEARKPFLKVSEDTIAKKLYFGLGRWIEYNWNFDEGSRFSHYLRQKGLNYTEDMTRTMLILFHRHVLGKPLESDILIKKMVEERKKKIAEELKKKEVISEETKTKTKND